MILVFGSAYQGKLDFAKKTFGIETEEILDMPAAVEMSDAAFIKENIRSAKCIYRPEVYVKDLMERGLNPEDWVNEINDDCVVIMNDMSQGLVPMTKEDREYRETLGRIMITLAGRSKEVYRVFLGIPTTIK